MTSTDALGTRLSEVECVLFDLDGTLIDTIELIRESMRYATAKVLGEPLPDDVLMHNVGMPLIQQMSDFDAERAEELVATYREHNHRVHDAMVREYPGVRQALETLSGRGFKLGIVTSKSRSVALMGLDRFSLGGFFETMVCFDDVEIHKPKPYPLLVAAEHLATPIERCVYVGDSPHDMTAAVAAGCISVAATWGGFSRERVTSPGPDYAADSMSDVVAILSGHERGFRLESESSSCGE